MRIPQFGLIRKARKAKNEDRKRPVESGLLNRKTDSQERQFEPAVDTLLV